MFNEKGTFNLEALDANLADLTSRQKRQLVILNTPANNPTGYSMTPQEMKGVADLVKKYAKMAVPSKKITPHKLRSTYGTALYRETGDIRLVADVLGHENVNTTIDYYAAIEDGHKRRAANAV